MPKTDTQSMTQATETVKRIGQSIKNMSASLTKIQASLARIKSNMQNLSGFADVETVLKRLDAMPEPNTDKK